MDVDPETYVHPPDPKFRHWFVPLVAIVAMRRIVSRQNYSVIDRIIDRFTNDEYSAVTGRKKGNYDMY